MCLILTSIDFVNELSGLILDVVLLYERTEETRTNTHLGIVLYYIVLWDIFFKNLALNQ